MNEIDNNKLNLSIDELQDEQHLMINEGICSPEFSEGCIYNG